MSQKRHNWYNALAKANAPLIPAGVGRFLFVRKRAAFVGSDGTQHPEAVQVWNGRHFITVLTPEQARENLVLGNVVGAGAQKDKDIAFDFFLNY